MIRIWVCSLFVCGGLLGVAGLQKAFAANNYRCLGAKLCLNSSFRSAVKAHLKKGYRAQPKLTKMICKFYLPKKHLRSRWQCVVLLKKKKQMYLVARRGKLVYAFVSNQKHLSTVGSLRRKWGRETKLLRSLEGTNLFWRLRRSSSYVIGAFLPYDSKQKKVSSKTPSSGIFLVHTKKFKGTPYASVFHVIQGIRAHKKKGKRWPSRCFHTLCLGERPALSLQLLQVQGYRANQKIPFKNCRKMFTMPGFRGKLKCQVLQRKRTRSTLRLVWVNDRLVFVQGERLFRPPTLRRLRWVWGPERVKMWVRGMLFVQWRKARHYRYVLSIPMFGEKNDKRPIAQRHPVGFILVDWKMLRPTKMGKTLKGLLRF